MAVNHRIGGWLLGILSMSGPVLGVIPTISLNLSPTLEGMYFYFHFKGEGTKE